MSLSTQKFSSVQPTINACAIWLTIRCTRALVVLLSPSHVNQHTGALGTVVFVLARWSATASFLMVSTKYSTLVYFLTEKPNRYCSLSQGKNFRSIRLLSRARLQQVWTVRSSQSRRTKVFL